MVIQICRQIVYVFKISEMDLIVIFFWFSDFLYGRGYNRLILTGQYFSRYCPAMTTKSI